MKRDFTKLLLILSGTAVLFLAVVGVFRFVTTRSSANSGSPESSETSESEENSEPSEPETPESILIDLQPFIDDWSASAAGITSVAIYDLDNDQLVGSKNLNRQISTASLYKLYVTYQGYLDREAGKLDGESTLVGSYSWNDCLDLAIRESNSTCGEAMLAKYRSTINETISSEWGIKNTNVPGLTTTPEDMVKMLQIYYAHEGLSAETWDAIRDSMLNQPPSAGLCSGPCQWRQGLPSGFSEKVNVYNKVGWEHSGSGNIWNLYHDTAIVEFPEYNRHFIVVVMTEKSLLKDVVDFGTKFEKYVNGFYS